MTTKPVIFVKANVDFHGMSGFGYDGWAGETPEEAVLESFLQEGMEYGAAFDKMYSYIIQTEEA